jgi:hypothetical protein
VVLVGGVDEVAARIGEGVQDLVAVLLISAEAPGVAEAHGAKAQLRDPQAARAQQFVAHGAPILSV